jgi:hypothetical protein
MQRLKYLAMGALVIAGCASSQASREPTTPAPAATSGMQSEGMRGDMEGMCPMQVEGTSVAAEDVDGGVALTFTTSSDVAELRRRVARMAQMHGQHGMGMHARAGADHGHAHGGQRGDAGQHQGGMMPGGMMMPAATARSEEVESGARIVLTPQDAADLEKLREHARHMTQRMSSGQCPMMSMHGEAAEPPPASSEDHESTIPKGTTELFLQLRGDES